jgi:hypothetical protein
LYSKAKHRFREAVVSFKKQNLEKTIDKIIIYAIKAQDTFTKQIERCVKAELYKRIYSLEGGEHEAF